MRIRNQLWHYLLRYPPATEAVRMAVPLGSHLLECVYRGHPGVWAVVTGEAWRERHTVAPYRRRLLLRAVIRRVERNRGDEQTRAIARQAGPAPAR